MGNRPNRHRFTGLGFTERLTASRQIGYYPYPEHLCDGAVLVVFVVDQLLVSEVLAGNKAFRKELGKFANPTGMHVFDPEKSGLPLDKNVQVWRLKHAHGRATHADVAETVWTLRKHVPKKLPRSMIAPNHVLVSPGHMHECPWGPPEEHGPVALPDRASPLVDVVVIDSGYISNSPIAALVPKPMFGDWLGQVPGAGPPILQWQQGTEAPPGIADPRDQNGDNKLDALAGHADFVAGVVAQASANANIIVDSFNSSVLDSDSDPAFVTEAAVARALWEHRHAPVINLGFAFATLPDHDLTGYPITAPEVNGPPSWALQAVLDSIDDAAEHVIVAPAGNQDCVVPQYPAAFSRSHDNVVGVGSVTRGGAARSWFSNYGNWVSCCTEGEDVASAFVDDWVNRETEDGEPTPGVPPANWPHPKKTFEGWASWSGTSFASPKVAGAIASDVAASIVAGGQLTPLAAWQQRLAGGQKRPDLHMGVLLDGLPPA